MPGCLGTGRCNFVMNQARDDQRLEALLFAAGEPLAFSQLRTLLGIDTVGLTKAVDALNQRLVGGLRLVLTDTHAALTTAPECDEDVRAFLTPFGDEREIGQAGLEVLAIILYQGPSTKASIDYVRGVNSASTLRTLFYRGLIDRSVEGREISYHATPEMLTHLGITSLAELPDIQTIQMELADFMRRSEPTQPEEPAAV